MTNRLDISARENVTEQYQQAAALAQKVSLPPKWQDDHCSHDGSQSVGELLQEKQTPGFVPRDLSKARQSAVQRAPEVEGVIQAGYKIGLLFSGYALQL